MKLQVEAQSLRLRLSERDLADLLRGDVLQLSPRARHALLFDLHVALGVRLSFDVGTRWQLTLPRDAIEAHAATLPSRDGLAFELDGEPPLHLRVDVDVRDSLATRGTTPRR